MYVLYYRTCGHKDYCGSQLGTLWTPTLIKMMSGVTSEIVFLPSWDISNNPTRPMISNKNMSRDRHHDIHYQTSRPTTEQTFLSSKESEFVSLFKINSRRNSLGPFSLKEGPFEKTNGMLIIIPNAITLGIENWELSEKVYFSTLGTEKITTISKWTINPMLHGGEHNQHAHVDDLAWHLGRRSKWAHISWLCFF